MSAPVQSLQPMNSESPQKILRDWAKAYRDSPMHRFPCDPHAEFFPVDMEAAAARIEELEARAEQAERAVDVLEAALKSLTEDPPATLDDPDEDWEVIVKMRAIARAALESKP